MDKNRKLIGHLNYQEDLLVNIELTNGRKLIIRKMDLRTNKPPKESTIKSPDSEYRKLNPEEIKELIKQRLQEFDKNQEKRK